MRIGIDARLWSESGIGRYIRNLVVNLAKIDKKNSYVIFILQENKDEIKKLIGKNWEIVEANFRWHSVEEQSTFPKVLKKQKLDLVHFPYFSVPVSYKKPFIVTIHDLIINHFPTGEASTLNPIVYKFKLKAYELVIGSAAKKSKSIITVSNTTKKEIVEHFKVSAKKIFVTYEGVDDQIYGSVKNNTKEKYFLYVGNAYPHKNLTNLIKAFNLFEREINDFKLVLVGKEDYFYRNLKSSFQEKDSIVFKGKVTDSELHSLYDNATALIMPSLMEGFGLPVLEAISANCLVLASKIPTFEEIYDDCPIYFNPNDPSDILRTMKYSIDPKNNKSISEKIKKSYLFSKQFSWSKMAKQTLEVYEGSVSI
jgi:glycosyltransferase involved in cell wall biosynthesis